MPHARSTTSSSRWPSLKPKSFLKTLAKSLRIAQEELVEALIELPTLLSDQRVEEVIACAAAGAEGDERAPLDTCRGGPDEVAKLLRVELVSRLAEVLPAFESAGFALRTARSSDPAEKACK